MEHSEVMRVLIVIDGGRVSPEPSYLSARAQGGALIAYQLVEQCRRWISREIGKHASIMCSILADVELLGRTTGLAKETILAFSQGFSPTPTSCAFVHCLDGTTLAAIDSHVGFMLPFLDYIFLGGFDTEAHSRCLSKWLESFDRLSSAPSHRPKIILLGTARVACDGVSKLADGTAMFRGLVEIASAGPGQTLSTASVDAGSEQGSMIAAAPPQVPPVSRIVRPASPATMSRLAVLPDNTLTVGNPWNEVSEVPDRKFGCVSSADSVLAAKPLRPPGLFGAIGPVRSHPQSPTRSQASLAGKTSHQSLPPSIPPREAYNSSERSVESSKSNSSQSASPAPAFLNDREPPSIEKPPAARPVHKSAPTRGGMARDSDAVVNSPSVSVTERDSTPATTITSGPSVRVTARIPESSVELVRLINSLQLQKGQQERSNANGAEAPSSSPSRDDPGREERERGGIGETKPPVLWSTVGSAINRASTSSASASSRRRSSFANLVLPRGTKLKDLLGDLQRGGWVSLGTHGDSPGQEWVRVTKRAERALVVAVARDSTG